MSTYGTKVPYNGHICALSGAMIQNKLLDSLILISRPRQFFPMFAKLERNEKETNLLKKTCLLNILYFTISFPFYIFINVITLHRFSDDS